MDPSSFPIGNIHLGIYDYTSLVFQIPPEVWCFGYVFRVQSYLLIRCLDAQGLVKDQRQNKSEHDEQFAFVSRHFCYFFHHGIWDSSPLNSLPFRGFFFDFFPTTEQSQIQESEVSHGVPPLWLGDSPKKNHDNFFWWRGSWAQRRHLTTHWSPNVPSLRCLWVKKTTTKKKKQQQQQNTSGEAWDMIKPLIQKWWNMDKPLLNPDLHQLNRTNQ